ncbi:hypothetical protein BAS10_04590 [Elizabethkingia meningoseptica]|uniref:hypothetical protein n=1 Tax=Elizabethkingia meningoseptica TaxID=238 RepID=UPI00099966B1|nr:hypothetical protein [Elizabethkingia meningoseptica]OPB98949.1 hypothetical protein BAS10_04590 [Elizabethkingia meningoseptica]
MSNEKFNFYKFLIVKGYSKEVVREISGKTFATIYQKEVAENTWNALTVNQDKTFTASSHTGALEFKNKQQPTSEAEAVVILETIEKVNITN